ncbi:hypothetical protein EVAR_6197_1 [Eumeta japonica]|uniref:Uncharacterized protein n=1 Tax=Eumeta variegata TaxID=151549 RepID=A0A4C2A0Q1_EUMVA|nr:hypothetical protein EVAR_6197_1 [Eumeta japonica]
MRENQKDLEVDRILSSTDELEPQPKLSFRPRLYPRGHYECLHLVHRPNTLPFMIPIAILFSIFIPVLLSMPVRLALDSDRGSVSDCGPGVDHLINPWRKRRPTPPWGTAAAARLTGSARRNRRGELYPVHVSSLPVRLTRAATAPPCGRVVR